MLFTSKFQKAEVAQSVEQGTENPRVGSSILSLGTMNLHIIKEGLVVTATNPFFIDVICCVRDSVSQGTQAGFIFFEQQWLYLQGMK